MASGRKMRDRWVSVDEIANFLGVSKDTIYAWLATRSMPCHKGDRAWKFRREEVDSGFAPEGCARIRRVGAPVNTEAARPAPGARMMIEVGT